MFLCVHSVSVTSKMVIYAHPFLCVRSLGTYKGLILCEFKKILTFQFFKNRVFVCDTRSTRGTGNLVISYRTEN